MISSIRLQKSPAYRMDTQRRPSTHWPHGKDCVDIRFGSDADVSLAALPIRNLLKLDDEPFLKAVAERYPEVKWLAGKSEASPVGNQTLRPDAMTYSVLSDENPDPTAIEAERTFLSLLLFKDILAHNNNKFPNLSKDNFNTLCDLTHSIVQTDQDIEFVLYSVACNDLGKTQRLIDECIQLGTDKLYGEQLDDHDQRLMALVREKPSLFEGLHKLSSQPEVYISYATGLRANFNLPQFVQGESLPANLLKIQTSREKDRNLRLLTELFDFAGATANINGHQSLMMNDNNFFAFNAAISELMKQPLNQAYKRYIAIRAEKAGILPSADPTLFTPETFAQGRLVAMSRTFTPDGGNAITRVWNRLSDQDRGRLTRELNETGTGQQAGLLLYYAPAVILNAVKATGDFETGLTYALQGFARVCQNFRQTLSMSGLMQGLALEPGKGGVITINLAHMARIASSDPESIVTRKRK